MHVVKSKGDFMSAKLTPILEVARDILKTAGLKGMHVDTIADEAAKQIKTMGLSVEDFSKRLQGALASNLKLKTQRPSFARVEGKNLGRLRRDGIELKLKKHYLLLLR